MSFGLRNLFQNSKTVACLDTKLSLLHSQPCRETSNLRKEIKMCETLTRFIFPWSSWHFVTHIVSNTLWCMFRSFGDKSTRQVGTNNQRSGKKAAWIFMNGANRPALNEISSRTWLRCCCVLNGFVMVQDWCSNLIIVNVNKLFDFLTWESSQLFMHNAVVLFAVPVSLEIQVFNCSDKSLINNAKMRRKTQLSRGERIIAHLCS